MLICQDSAYFKFILYTHMHALTHTHTHTLSLSFSHTQTHTHKHILIPFEDCELMGLKVDIAFSNISEE